MTEKKNIHQIVEFNLCTMCGTCEALCPNNAIKMRINKEKGIYLPKVDKNACNSCEICCKICPGYEIDFKLLNNEIYGKAPENILVGNYINCYVGYSNNQEVRYNSSSGGLVTETLIFAIEKELIDGVLVTRMDKKDPLKPEPFIARTKEEIVEASGSKYCPVPANVALKEILESKENERFAVVGLPCHIHGLLKAKTLNNNLKNKIILTIGLFCAGSKSYLGTEFILKKNRINPNNVKKINYRGMGWPGKLRIELKDKIIDIPMDQYYNNQFCAFTPWRCTLCPDHTCELADISFGDAWLPEFKNDKKGKSIVVSRTNLSKKILEDMCAEKRLYLKPLSISKLIQSQGNFNDKKRNTKAKMDISKFLNKKTPKLENYCHSTPRFSIYIYYFLYYLQVSLASNKKYWWAFEKLTNFYQKILK